MIYKNEYHVPKHILEGLPKIIGASCDIIYTRSIGLNVVDSDKAAHTNYSLEHPYMIFRSFDHDIMGLELSNYHEYDQINGDEISLVKPYLIHNNDSNRSWPLSERGGRLVFASVGGFVISKVKIYGQDRIRNWSKEAIQNQTVIDFEGMKLNFPFKDQLITHEIFILENLDGKQLVFRSDRFMNLFITENYESTFEDWFYFKDNLDMNFMDTDDYANGVDIISQEKVMKLHYLFE